MSDFEELCNTLTQSHHVWDPDENLRELHNAYEATLACIASSNCQAQVTLVRSHVKRYKYYLSFYGFGDLPFLAQEVRDLIARSELDSPLHSLLAAKRIDEEMLRRLDAVPEHETRSSSSCSEMLTDG